jgi:DegV family protein with EDD domain
MKIAVVTDGSAGFNAEEIKKYKNLFILDIPFFVNNKEYVENKGITREEFFNLLDDSNTEVHTSQPSISSVTNMWSNILKEYDYIIHIPISSGLSSSYSTSQMLANEDEFIGKVFPIDLQRISFSLKISCLEALIMIEEGFNVREIIDYLIKNKFNSSIYINVPDLKYLKKGGRLTKSVALIASLLKIKPVLQIQGEKLDLYKKAHSLKQCTNIQINAIKDDLNNRFKEYLDNNEMVLAIAYTNNFDEAMKMKELFKSEFPNLKVYLIDPLCLTISCHIGKNCLGVGLSRIRKELL